MFDRFTEERVLLISRSGGDLRPVLRLQNPNRRWEESALLHGHMAPLLLDEVANDVVYGVPQEFPIG
jgi:hypothetical protein